MPTEFLIAGGSKDPCLQLLASRSARIGLDVKTIFHDAQTETLVSLGSDGILAIDGRAVEPDAAFIRMDVFSGGLDTQLEVLPRAPGWFSFAMGAVAANRAVRVFNRAMKPFAGNKVADLALARECGLPVPNTLVSNDVLRIEDFASAYHGCIAKPVNGGGYCRDLSHSLAAAEAEGGRLPLPAFVQETLAYPEYRIYRIGDDYIVFQVESAELDYRIDRNSRMTMLPIERFPAEELLAQLENFSDRLGLDFCAFDLKTRPRDGAICFLEVNTGPMFTAHDHASEGLLSELIVQELCAASSP